MTSFEIELDGVVRGISPCKNLSGHNILDYVIHGGKKVPSYDNGSQEKVKVLVKNAGERAVRGGDLRVHGQRRDPARRGDESLHAHGQAGHEF